jgi:hypothetical protein
MTRSIFESCLLALFFAPALGAAQTRAQAAAICVRNGKNA